MGDKRGRNQSNAGLIILPRKRRTPLKRYMVLATLPGGRKKIYLVIRARSKKNACFFAMQDYVIIKAEIVAVLGRSKEIDDM